MLLNLDEEAERYFRLMCTRKGTTPEDYILGNLEWDPKPDCLHDEVLTEIPDGMCRGCEYFDRCPDAEPRKVRA
jgi:hypothetical protein